MNAVIQSFLEGKKKKQGNGQTDGRSLFLFGNLIAEHKPDGLYVTNAGWPTRTTNKWLNMLPNTYVNMYRKEPYLNGQKWDGEFTKVNENTQPDRQACRQNASTRAKSTSAWMVGEATLNQSTQFTASLTPVDGTTALIQMPTRNLKPKLLSSRPKRYQPRLSL
jgi:hypothetical protein